MKIWSWLSQTQEGKEREHRIDRCDDVAYLLMAFLDEEGTPEQMRRVRDHILICNRCASFIREWNEARGILRSEPVPAPPPTFLWRILMACRWAGTDNPKEDRTATTPSAPALDWDPSTPPSLKDSILAATVGKTPTPVLVRPKPRKTLHPLSWPAMASPALALWLVFLNVAPSVVPSKVQPASLEAAGPSPALAVPMELPVKTKPKADRGEAKELEPVATKIEAVQPVNAPENSEAVAAEVPVRPVKSASREVVREEVRWVAPATTGRSVSEEHNVEQKTEAKPVIVRAITTVAPPASMADDQLDSPRSQRASFRPLAKAAIVRSARTGGGMRVSTPDEPISTPLVLASTGDTDSRLDEMQSTVQDFRALFATDTSSDDSAADSSVF